MATKTRTRPPARRPSLPVSRTRFYYPLRLRHFALLGDFITRATTKIKLAVALQRRYDITLEKNCYQATLLEQDQLKLNHTLVVIKHDEVLPLISISVHQPNIFTVMKIS